MIKLLDAFSGIGGFHLALEQSIGKENVTCIGYSEIDKFAKQVYAKNFPGCKDLGDITKIDIENLEEFDILTGGFPCQDVSVAGKQNLEGGRTILVEYLLQILEKKQPEYFIFENVKNLLGKQFAEFSEIGKSGKELKNPEKIKENLKLDSDKFFNSIIFRIKELGYNFKFKILNTKDFGLPQNRQRVFIVGSLKSLENFDFPEGQKLEKTLKDILEKDIDIKYNLTEKQLDRIKNSTLEKEKETLLNIIKCINPKKINGKQTEQQNRIYKDNGIIPSLSSQLGGRFNIKLKDFSTFSQDNTFIGNNDIVPTLTAGDGGNRPKTYTRRLTPKECLKLQGFPKNWCELVSDNQSYRQAGNAISVPVVKAIFDNLLKDELLKNKSRGGLIGYLGTLPKIFQ